MTNTDRVPTTINPIVSENICLKKRVETLIRTAAISDIEVQQLKEEIREAQEILAQLAQVM
jgi:mevalonate kinase